VDRSGTARGDLGSLLGNVDAAGQLDGVLLLTSGGDVLAGWNRGRGRQEVLSIMSATMIGSVDVLLEELRGRRPRRMIVEADLQRILVLRTREDNLLVLLAPSAVSKKDLYASGKLLLGRLAGLPPKAESKSHVYVSRP
jgi:predicted regulator of Ras-like GTPase activity (Roadblock/LC7/MglB family)